MLRTRCGIRRLLAAAIVMVAPGACRDAGTTAPGDVHAAKGGQEGGSIAVNAVDPEEVEQGTVGLDLRVAGDGFEPGTEISFELNGKPAKKLITNSTTFVSDRELIANIDVAIDADPAAYDVVATRGPSKGVGSELLRVNTPPGQTEPYPLAITIEDGGQLLGDGGAYVHGLVPSARIRDNGNLELVWSLADDPSGRLVYLDFSRAESVDVAAMPSFYDPDGDGCGDGDCVSTRDGSYLTTQYPTLEGGISALAPGETLRTGFFLTWSAEGWNWLARWGGRGVTDDGFCQDVRFQEGLGNTDIMARVTAVDTDADGAVDVWDLEAPSRPGSYNMVLCRSSTKGRPTGPLHVGRFDIPARLTLRLIRP